MNDYSSLLYSEKSVLATDCYDLIPLTYEKRGILSALTFLFPLKTPPQSNLTPCHGEDAIANIKAKLFVIQIAWARRGTLALLHSCNSKGIGGDSANLRISDLNTS